MRDQERTAASPTGHRRASAREVGTARLLSVGELIRRQPESLRATLPHPDTSGEEPTDRVVTGEIAPMRLSVRVASGAVAVFLLVGGATATSVVLSRAPTSSSGNAVTRTEPVTGMPALRPDLLMARAGWSPAEIPDATSEPALPLPGLPLPGPGQESAGPDNLWHEDSASLLQANPSAGSTRGAVALVKDFYGLLDRDPDQAATLLAPRLLGSQAEEFADSWRTMESVRARHVRPGPEGSVVAEVAATGAAGGRVVLRHELTVEDGSTTPRIVTVELLTAQLSHGSWR